MPDFDFSTDVGAAPRQQKDADGFLVMLEGTPDVPGLVTSLIQRTRTETATAYTFVITDSGRLILASGASPAFTIPLNAAVAFEVGTLIIVRPTGTGRLRANITGAGTLNNITAGTYDMMPGQDHRFYQRAVNVWEITTEANKYAMAIVMSKGAYNL